MLVLSSCRVLLAFVVTSRHRRRTHRVVAHDCVTSKCLKNRDVSCVVNVSRFAVTIMVPVRRVIVSGRGSNGVVSLFHLVCRTRTVFALHRLSQ